MRNCSVMSQSDYIRRVRRSLSASPYSDNKLWERLEKQAGSALTNEELKKWIGWINSKGQFVKPIAPLEHEGDNDAHQSKNK